MRREWIPDVYQVVGFVYFAKGSESQKFKCLYATDFLKAALINSKSERHLGKLVDPYYSGDQLRRILSKAERKSILNAKVLEVKPEEKSSFYLGKVKPMNPDRTEPHRVSIINAHDFENVEFSCDCDKQDKRHIRSVWHRRILGEWGLDRPYHAFSTCPHICAVNSHVTNATGSSPLGLDGFDNPAEYRFPDSLKPYVVGYIDVNKKFPSVPDYVLDFLYPRKSSMFDPAKKQVDKLREGYGLKEYTFYSDKAFEDEVIGKMGISRETVKEISGIIAY